MYLVICLIPRAMVHISPFFRIVTWTFGIVRCTCFLWWNCSLVFLQNVHSAISFFSSCSLNTINAIFDNEYFQEYKSRTTDAKWSPLFYRNPKLFKKKFRVGKKLKISLKLVLQPILSYFATCIPNYKEKTVFHTLKMTKDNIKQTQKSNTSS